MSEIRECEISASEVLDLKMPLNEYAIKVLMKQKGIKFDGIVSLKYCGIMIKTMSSDGLVMHIRQEL